MVVTSPPTSMTSPANSWPIVIGSGGARPTQDQSPCHVCQSVRQMPSTATLTIASRGPGVGSGTSSITRGCAISTSRAALNSVSSRSHGGGRTDGRTGSFHASLCSVYVERRGGAAWWCRCRRCRGVSAHVQRRTWESGFGWLRGSPPARGRGRYVTGKYAATIDHDSSGLRRGATAIAAHFPRPPLTFADTKPRRQRQNHRPHAPRQSRAASTSARASSAGRVNITSWLPPISTSLNVAQPRGHVRMPRARAAARGRRPRR